MTLSIGIVGAFGDEIESECERMVARNDDEVYEVTTTARVRVTVDVTTWVKAQDKGAGGGSGQVWSRSVTSLLLPCAPSQPRE